MSAAALRGVFPYLVSPIRDSGEVDAPVLARLCDDLIQAGVHGLTPLGSTGEFAYLNREQRRRVVEVVVQAARGRVMGRGTTPFEAALLGRIPWGNDANPLSVIMTAPRLHPPTLPEVEARLAAVALDAAVPCPDDLLVFYDPETLRAICSLRQYLLERQKTGQADRVDDRIGLVALNRLTGHSNGFFSVYTLPPNQAVSVKSQRRINERRNQTPLRRDVRRIILKKSRILLRDLGAGEARATLARVAAQARLA